MSRFVSSKPGPNLSKMAKRTPSLQNVRRVLWRINPVCNTKARPSIFICIHHKLNSSARNNFTKNSGQLPAKPVAHALSATAVKNVESASNNNICDAKLICFKSLLYQILSEDMEIIKMRILLPLICSSTTRIYSRILNEGNPKVSIT